MADRKSTSKREPLKNAITMNQAQFIRYIASETGETMTDTKKWLDIILRGIYSAMELHRTVALRGLGTFSVQYRTGDPDFKIGGRPVPIPPAYLTTFKMSKMLKTAPDKKLD